MTSNDWLYSQNLALIVGFLLLCFLALQELGFRAGRNAARRAAKVSAQMQALEAGILTLFGLLLGFTFSAAESRYEQRREVVIAEANAIGTAHLRAQALPPESGRGVGEALSQYLDARMVSYQAPIKEIATLREANRRADELQNRFWTLAAEEARKRPTAVASSMLAALNEVIDLREKQIAVFENHIPQTVLTFLFAISLAAMATVGYLNGLGRGRQLGLSLLFTIVIAMTISLVLDLDRPHRGRIRLSHSSLLRLRESLPRSQ